MSQSLKQAVKKSSFKISVLLFLYLITTFLSGVVYFIIKILWFNQEPNETEITSEIMGIPLLSMAILAIIIVYFFRQRTYFIKDLTYSAKSMQWPVMIIVLLLIFTGNAFTEVIINLFMQFNIDISASYEAVFNHITYTPYNILYIGIVGPIAEEILFRGAVLRTFLPYGRNFAIITSALLFGLMHGDAVQFMSAGLLGLVLAVVAINYGMRWTIAIHIFNNLVLSLGMSLLSEPIQQYTTYFTFLSPIIVIVLGYYYRDKLSNYYQEGRVNYPVFKYWLSSKLMLAWVILSIILTIFSGLNYM